jgi:hypothetical protein
MKKQSNIAKIILSAAAVMAFMAPVGAEELSEHFTCTRMHQPQHRCCLVSPYPLGYQPPGSYNNAIKPGEPTASTYLGPVYACRYRLALQNAPGTFNNPIKPGEPTPGPIPTSVPVHDCCAHH